MSNNHSEHLSQKQNQLEGKGFLPPRHTRHGKRKDEETEEEMEREKSFPLIQIVLYTFLAIIAAFLIFWFWQENKTAPSSNKPSTESQEESLQNDADDSMSGVDGDQQDDSTSGMAEPKQDDSKETNSDLRDQGQQDVEGSSKGEAGEGSDEGNEQDPADESSGEENQSNDDILAEHIVQPGETLYSITMKYYYSKKYMDHLAEYNGIKDTRNIEAGMKLMIPEKP